ncbi:MAG: RimK/LysX family protein [Myxococcota bacterium]
MKTRSPKKPKMVVGWREWADLPDLRVEWLKTKVDTGARTSSLHAEDLEFFTVNGREMVRFTVFVDQYRRKDARRVEAALLDRRKVRSSNGQQEERPVIETTLLLGEEHWTIELTLARRDMMGFRMLIGRQGLRRHAVVDPGRSFLTRRKPKGVTSATDPASPPVEHDSKR